MFRVRSSADGVHKDEAQRVFTRAAAGTSRRGDHAAGHDARHDRTGSIESLLGALHKGWVPDDLNKELLNGLVRGGVCAGGWMPNIPHS